MRLAVRRQWQAPVVALIACAALGWASIADAKSQEGWSLYDSYTKSYTIPFARPLDFRHDPAGAFVNVSVNGGSSATFQLDTGSQGMVVPRSLVPDYVPKGKTASIHYASSGVTAYGHWAKVSVDFTDSTDASGNVGVASAKVPVLVADKVCDANGCSTDTSRLPLMIGIGFGRPDEEATGHHATLADNPLLHIGLRVEALLPAPAGEPALTLHGMVGWQHVFGDLTPTEMLALAGAPQAFAVAGAPLAEDSVLLDLGLDLLVSDRLRFGVSYVGNIAAAAEDNAFKATLLTRF